MGFSYSLPEISLGDVNYINTSSPALIELVAQPVWNHKNSGGWNLGQGDVISLADQQLSQTWACGTLRGIPLWAVYPARATLTCNVPRTAIPPDLHQMAVLDYLDWPDTGPVFHESYKFAVSDEANPGTVTVTFIQPSILPPTTTQIVTSLTTQVTGTEYTTIFTPVLTVPTTTVIQPSSFPITTATVTTTFGIPRGKRVTTTIIRTHTVTKTAAHCSKAQQTPQKRRADELTERDDEEASPLADNVSTVIIHTNLSGSSHASLQPTTTTSTVNEDQTATATLETTITSGSVVQTKVVPYTKKITTSKTTQLRLRTQISRVFVTSTVYPATCTS